LKEKNGAPRLKSCSRPSVHKTPKIININKDLCLLESTSDLHRSTSTHAHTLLLVPHTYRCNQNLSVTLNKYH